MTAILLDGRALAATMRGEIQAEVTSLQEHHGVTPMVAVVVVGNDLASQRYAKELGYTAKTVGVGFIQHALPETTQPQELKSLIEALNRDKKVSGIVIARPLPPHLSTELVTNALAPAKDVEGIHPLNVGLFIAEEGEYTIPAAPGGGMELLLRAGIPTAGKHAVVVGRSNVVGKPMALMLLHAHATVTICHSQTTNLAELTRLADILVAAAGRPYLIQADMVKPEVVVIDFGTTVVDGRLVGDVEFRTVRRVASAITPVPGGTGPMTTVMVMRNVIQVVKRALRAQGAVDLPAAGLYNRI